MFPILTTHSDICGLSACASFCMDDIEVAEENKLKREWCISTLKNSSLLSYFSFEGFATMEHMSVVSDEKHNKMRKYVGNY